MEYQYLISEDMAAALAAEYTEASAKNRGQLSFIEFATNIIKQRLHTKSASYLEYGIYWPALKKLLNKYGANLGDDLINDPIANIYGNFTSEEAIISAAENFREYYKESFFSGTNTYTIDELGSIWVLYDSDMEEMH